MWCRKFYVMSSHMSSRCKQSYQNIWRCSSLPNMLAWSIHAPWMRYSLWYPTYWKYTKNFWPNWNRVGIVGRWTRKSVILSWKRWVTFTHLWIFFHRISLNVLFCLIHHRHSFLSWRFWRCTHHLWIIVIVPRMLYALRNINDPRLQNSWKLLLVSIKAN